MGVEFGTKDSRFTDNTKTSDGSKSYSGSEVDNLLHQVILHQ